MIQVSAFVHGLAPHNMSVALYDNNSFDEQFSVDRIKDNKVLDLAQKVFVYSNNRFSQMYPHNWGCELKVITKDNREFKKEILNAKGDTENPLTQDEFQNKFKELTKNFLTQDRQEQVITKIYGLEEVKSVREITSCLSLGL